MTEKIDVNGDDRHEIYRSLVEQPNEKGESGDVTWNFEKFLVDAQGEVVARFRPKVLPDDPRLVEAIKQQLAQSGAVFLSGAGCRERSRARLDDPHRRP